MTLPILFGQNQIVVGGGPPPSNFWTNLMAVVASADPYHDDGRITKNDAVDDYGTSGAFSVDGIDRSLGVRMIWDSASENWCAVGLSKVDVAGDRSLILFGFEARFGQMSVVQSGSYLGDGINPLPREIRITPDGEVTFYTAGNCSYVSPTNASAGVYHVAVAIHTIGHFVDRIRLIENDRFWGASFGVGFTADSLHPDGKVTKTYSGDSWGIGNCYSTASFVRADDRKLVWTVDNVATAGMFVGLDSRPFDTSHSRAGYEMFYSFGVNSAGGGTFYIYESSSNPVTGAIANGDVLEIRVSVAGVVTYYKNGSLLYTSGTPISAGVPYKISAAIYHTGDHIQSVNLV